MNADKAKLVTDISLYNLWAGQYQYHLYLPYKYLYLKPSDIIEVTIEGKKHVIKISNIDITEARLLKVSGVSTDPSLLKDYQMNGDFSNNLDHDTKEQPSTQYEILDIPLLPGEQSRESRILFAACGKTKSWQGCSVFSDIGGTYKEILSTSGRSVIGGVVDKLSAEASSFVIDKKSKARVNLFYGELYNISEDNLLNHGNLALIGNEIVQFQKAKLIDNNQYELSCFMRGLYGTENLITEHQEGERFVLLDERVLENRLEIPKKYKGHNINYNIATYNTDEEIDGSIYCNGNSLNLLQPVHISVSSFSGGTIKITWFGRNNNCSVMYKVSVFREGKAVYSAKAMQPSLIIDGFDYNENTDTIEVVAVENY